jgi:hypothetical protein
MAYTPSFTFNLFQDNYIVVPDYQFEILIEDVKGDLIASTDNVGGVFLSESEIFPDGTLNQLLENNTPSFSASVLTKSSGNFSKNLESISVTLNSSNSLAASIFDATDAVIGKLYTPSGNVEFETGLYTPFLSFTFKSTPGGGVAGTSFTDNITSSILAGVGLELNLNITLDNTVSDISAHFPPMGELAATLDNVSPLIEALNTVFSDINSVLGDTNSNIDVLNDYESILSQTLDGIASNIDALNSFEANLIQTLDNTSSVIIVNFPIRITLDNTLQNVTPSIITELALAARLNENLDNVSPDIIANASNDITIDVDLANVTSSIIGDIYVQGVIAATLNVIPDINVKNRFNDGVFQDITLSDTIGAITGLYDSNVNRFIVSKVGSTIEQASYFKDNQVCSDLEIATKLQNEKCLDQKEAAKLSSLKCSNEQDASNLFNEKCTDNNDATLKLKDTCFQNDNTIVVNIKLKTVQEDATYISTKTEIEQKDGTFTTEKRLLDNDNTSDITHDNIINISDVQSSEYTPSYNIVFDRFDVLPQTIGVFDFNLISINSVERISFTKGVFPKIICSPSQIATSTDSITNHNYCENLQEAVRPANGRTPLIDPPIIPPSKLPPGGGLFTYVVPIKDVYTMTPTITATLDDGVTVINLEAVNLNFDVDSHSWRFTSNLLDPAQKPLIVQNADGTAKIIHVTINGVLWHLLVEEINTRREFVQTTIGISGRGLSALLGSPYKRKESFNQGSLLTVQQIADLIIPLGWSVVWDYPVWNVAAGAYSYSNLTPIEALKDIADKIGAVIIPSKDSQTITFSPRYPVYPWNFALTLPDVQINGAAIISLTEQPESSYQPNGVYVHGEENGGQLSFVRFNGTAGDRLAQTSFNGLMTDVIGTRVLGERILAGGYVQPTIKSISTFFDGVDINLFNIGDFVEILVDGVPVKGVVNSVSLVASYAAVSQSITIGERSNNVYIDFKEITPIQPTLVGTISSLGTDTALITLIDGGIERVKGTGTNGSNVYIKEGVIIADAPNLPTSTVVV